MYLNVMNVRIKMIVKYFKMLKYDKFFFLTKYMKIPNTRFIFDIP